MYVELRRLSLLARCALYIMLVDDDTPDGIAKAYKVAVLQRHELLGTHALGDILVVGGNAFAIHSSLDHVSLELSFAIYGSSCTSGEHLATLPANFSMGLVRPGMMMIDMYYRLR